MPYTLSSNVKQLALLPMRQKGKGGNVSPSNEVIIWQAGGEVEVAMDYVRTLESLLVDLGTQGAEKNFRLEISADGVNWKTVASCAGPYFAECGSQRHESAEDPFHQCFRQRTESLFQAVPFR